MKTFEEIFYESQHRICVKWTPYFRVYDRFFSRFRGRADLRFLEIGVSQGGSLDIWRTYFGPSATIVGIDIDPRCKTYEAGNTHVRIGSQSNPAFLMEVAREFGSFDLILDDGGHTMEQQTVTFSTLYPILAPGGVFVVEDTHTSYNREFGGGFLHPGSFVELAKRKVDELNGYHVRKNPKMMTDFTRTTTGMSFFDSMVVFEKGAVDPPRMVQTGVGS